MNELELLEENIIKLKILRQILEDSSPRDTSKEYNNEIIKIINESIDCITLSLKKIKKNYEEEYEIKFNLIKDDLEKYKQELKEKIKVKSKKLKKTEQNYQFITENVNDVISIFDKHFNLIYINKAQHKISGFSKDEIIGKKLTEYIHPADITRSFKFFQKIIEKGEGFGEFRLRCKDGSYVWLEVNAKIVNDNNGEVNAVLVSRDITERKLIEEKLKESEKKFKALYEKIYLGILLVTTDGTIIDCNQSFEKILGFTKEEIIGKKYKDLDILPKKIIPKLLLRLEKVSKGEKLPVIEFKVRKKNGEMIWARIKSTFIDVGTNSYIQIVGEDITELKQAEILVKRELEKLKELDQVKTEFITRISHELKTPLASIWGATEFLLEYYKEKMEQSVVELIEIINKGANRLKHLVDDLIDVSMINSKQLEFQVQEVNLTKILEYCINHLKFLAQKRNILISFNFQEEVYIQVDKIRIEQVFINILSNAIKNTPPKGKITIILEKNDNYADIFFKDTGVGLLKSEEDKLFKKFGKIERYGKEMDVNTQGSGLGLYLSKGIVELHGGTIWVESEGRNKGSTFIIRLPYSP